jgi:U3 small nucleolar RNA-associated protein 10
MDMGWLADQSRRQLGSRISPYIQSIFDVSLQIASRPSAPAGFIKQSLATLSGVLETVPTFVSGKQLTAVLRLVIHLRAKDEQASNAALGMVAKKIPTKVLFIVVMDLFAGVQKGEPSVSLVRDTESRPSLTSW